MATAITITTELSNDATTRVLGEEDVFASLSMACAYIPQARVSLAASIGSSSSLA